MKGDPPGIGTTPRAMAPVSPSRAQAELFAASILSLLVELILIRWAPATVHIVGFFANLVLIAAFLGLGIGLASGGDMRAALDRAFVRLAIAVAVLGVLGVVNVSLPTDGDYGLNEESLPLPITLPMPLVLIAVFALIAWATIPFGRLVAARFDALPRLRAYSINIGGSLVGVVLFSVLGWRETPPLVWFGLAVAILWFLGRSRAHALPVVLILVTLGAVHWRDSRGLEDVVQWSPYYKVLTHAIVPPPGDLDQGFVTDVNGQFLLSGLDLRADATLPATADPGMVRAVPALKAYYDFPFLLVGGARVLVLGAGAGNDVAAALRRGVEHVTAVEIDPVVLRLGRDHHPEHPYGSPRVRVVLADARRYLAETTDRFDIVLFATLDAHGLLSSAANLRLDSFVYTQESMRAARRALAPGGVMVLSFGPFRQDIQFRQYEMVRRVFGQEPLFFVYANGHRTLIAGDLARVRPDRSPAGWRQVEAGEIDAGLRRFPYARILATDDWPHLFIRDRSVPREYYGVLAGILALSVLFVRRGFGRRAPLNGHFLFLGAGFLLLETKSVTEFALLIGSTWQTNSLVFGVILAVILLANVSLMRLGRSPPLGLVYALLGVSLVTSFMWPISSWHVGLGAGVIALAALSLGVPIFLAAVVFATTFRRSERGSTALASNLIGAVIGGCLEYTSLVWGNRALAALALAMYGLSALLLVRRRDLLQG